MLRSVALLAAAESNDNGDAGSPAVCLPLSPARLRMPRIAHSHYQDPLDLLWLQAAAQLGIAVVRSDEAYASWDGKGTLTLASQPHLDADDCLAQMILHELCHLLVAGESARAQLDWGVDNTSPRDLVCEYATNRLQAALAQAYGLRQFLAVTTTWRRYYDALPLDPLAACSDPAQPLALAGWQRARLEPYRSALHNALAATAQMALALSATAPADSLWRTVQPAHPTGFHQHRDTSRQCSSCAWVIARKDGRLQCRQTRQGCTPAICYLGKEHSPLKQVVFHVAQTACERWEPKLVPADCFRCGACCHKGFDVVEVSTSEPFAQRHPELIEVRSADRHVVPRPAGRCIALTGDGSAAAPYLCRHYDERPRSCRTFAQGGDACLAARQRCGITG